MSTARKKEFGDVRQLAERYGVSIPTIYREVKAGRLPPPVYVTPTTPRWDLSEVDAALEARRMTPAHAMEVRRQARLEGPPHATDLGLITRR